MMHKSRLWVVIPVLSSFVQLTNINQALAAFDSGSTGADGAFNPTATIAIDLPPNGVLNYTTVTIPTGVTVTFKRNAANTPVTILATGNVTVGGSINVNGTAASGRTPGKGGPGGFDGGIGAYPTFCGQKGLGPGAGNGATVPGTQGSGGGGAGHAGGGGNGGSYYSTGSPGSGGASYSNVQVLPLIGGSGGGGGCANNSTSSGAGGGGGGAILIASSGTISVTGSIYASGGNGSGFGTTSGGAGGGGSGGAIKLIANVISGDGTLQSDGGTSASSYSPGGGGSVGRIRFEANSLLRNVNSSPMYSYQAAPGPVIPPGNPALSISSIGGVSVPAASSGKYSTPDILFGAGVTNPVSIVIQASNIPAGTAVVVTNVPEMGSASSASALLAGTDTASTASVNMTLSTQYANVIMVKATISLVVTAGLTGETPLYADGERVTKMRVTAIPGEKSTVTYITESGREFAGIM